VAPGGDSTDVGYGIRSAYHVSDTAYALIAGTSMASPHVAGAVALVANAGNYTSGLDFDKLRSVLTATTTRDSLVPVEPDCGTSAQWWEGSENALNYNFGAGRLDVFAAVNASTSIDLQKQNRYHDAEGSENPWESLNVLKEFFGDSSLLALGALGVSLILLLVALFTTSGSKESKLSTDDARRDSYNLTKRPPFPLVENNERGYGSTDPAQHSEVPCMLSNSGLAPRDPEDVAVVMQESPDFQSEHLINPQRSSTLSDSEVMQLAAFGFSLQAALHALEQTGGVIEGAIQQLSLNAEPAAALGIRIVNDDDVRRVTAAGFPIQSAVHALELCGESTSATKLLLR